MKTNKTYKTLASAYTSAEKVGATRFTNDAYYAQVCVCIGHTIKGGKEANKVALWNLVKYENTLCALECTKEKTFKWTAIGHFDSDGLLYPMGTPKQEDAPKQTEDKPHKRTRKVKGDNKQTKTALQLELDTLAGTGNNSAAHKIMCKHGLKDSRSDEYQATWKGYWWTIR